VIFTQKKPAISFELAPGAAERFIILSFTPQIHFNSTNTLVYILSKTQKAAAILYSVT